MLLLLHFKILCNIDSGSLDGLNLAPGCGGGLLHKLESHLLLSCALVGPAWGKLGSLFFCLSVPHSRAQWGLHVGEECACSSLWTD